MTSNTGEGLANRPRTIAVVGGGTAGYMTALAVKRRFSEMRVTVIESSAIPIIGVGEATTTLMPPFLHAQLGIDILELWKAVAPTLKLGVRFEWGLPDTHYYFDFPFDVANVLEAAAYDGDLRNQSVISLLMHEHRVPVMRGPAGQIVSLLRNYKFAYHLDNKPFVDFLAAAARRAGIEHVDMKIEDVVMDAAGRTVTALRGSGREERHEFFVDASGFGSILLGSKLGVRFESFASSLFCDRAIIATLPQGDTIQPYTTAETMSSGWCWRIPVVGADHRGYVYCSLFQDEASAMAEMRAKNPTMGEPRVVKFRSGRHEKFWKGNVVGVGNAYGFVEPLESTALHMVIVEIGYLIAGLERMNGAADLGSFERYANDAVGGHWDYLRWFLALHYKWNRRLNTPFWRAVRSDTDASGFEDLVDRYRREGAGPWMDGRKPVHGDPAFGFTGIATMLLGQHVPASCPPQPVLRRDEWSRRVLESRTAVRWALGQREALDVFRANPELLSDFATSPRSWCTGDRERIRIRGPEAPGATLTTDSG